MANFKALPIAAAVATALVAMSASAVEFHGYMRAGIGNNADGGSQVCYGNGGGSAHRVGRLGDECDMYAELTLSQEVYNRDGKKFGVVSTVAYGTEETLNGIQFYSQGNSWQGEDTNTSSPWNGGRSSVREMYATANGIIGDATLWAGKRFGQRKDIHIMDFFYLMNSGYGAGFDGLSAGPGKLSFQWTQAAKDGNAQTFDDEDNRQVFGDAGNWEQMNKLDLRYSLPVGSHSLEFIGIYGQQNLTESQEDAGSFDKGSYFLTVEHTMPLLGGFNKIAAQYGTNALALGASIDNFGGLNNAAWFGEGDGYRFIDHGLVKFGKQLEMAYALVYAEAKPDETDGNGWFEGESVSVVVRPVFKWNDIMSTALEVGYVDNTWENAWRNGTDAGNPGGNWDNGDLMKVTLAQQWSPLQNGGFWARPQFRLFVSSYSGDWAVEDADTMFGAQVEAWW